MQIQTPIQPKLLPDPVAVKPRQLRDYQGAAIDMVRAALARGKSRVVLQAATGAGKTAIAAAIIRMALSKGKRVMFCVPAISLIDQTVRSFSQDGIEGIGVIQADHPMTDYSQPVQVASVQTLGRRRPPDVDLVIVDECHLGFKSTHRLMERWDRVPFIGLSATPWAKGMAKHWNALEVAATTQDLISSGYLSPFVAYGPASPDLSGVKTMAGDYHEGQLSEAMQRGSLVADIVTNWIQRADWQPTLVFCVDRAHAKAVQKQFLGAGVDAGYIDAYTELHERDQIGDQFNAKQLPVVVNVGCLTTGVDWDVRCIVLARPTKSEMLYVQIVGRGLRTADGKSECVLFDHSDTILRLGMVTDIHYDALDDGKPKKKSEAKERDEPLPKKCLSCDYLKPAKVHECPMCGFKPEKPSQVETVEGELVALHGKKKKKVYTKKEKQNWYSELRRYAKTNGYSPGWVAHKYRAKFDVWPKGLEDTERPVSVDVSNFIRYQNIKWAKSRKQANG